MTYPSRCCEIKPRPLAKFRVRLGGTRLDVAQMRRNVNYLTVPQWPHGAVIDQSPMGGARIPASATIKLLVT